MVVQSIALPQVSGQTRDHELSVGQAETFGAVAVAGRGSFGIQLVVPLIVATQAAWLAVLGYAAYRVLT